MLLYVDSSPRFAYDRCCFRVHTVHDCSQFWLRRSSYSSRSVNADFIIAVFMFIVFSCQTVNFPPPPVRCLEFRTLQQRNLFFWLQSQRHQDPLWFVYVASMSPASISAFAHCCSRDCVIAAVSFFSLLQHLSSFCCNINFLFAATSIFSLLQY